MSPYVGRLTNKHITTTCPQRRFLVDEQRKLGFDCLKFWSEDAFCMMTSSSYSKKRSFFTTDITSIGTLMLSKGP